MCEITTLRRRISIIGKLSHFPEVTINDRSCTRWQCLGLPFFSTHCEFQLCSGASMRTGCVLRSLGHTLNNRTRNQNRFLSSLWAARYSLIPRRTNLVIWFHSSFSACTRRKRRQTVSLCWEGQRSGILLLLPIHAGQMAFT